MDTPYAAQQKLTATKPSSISRDLGSNPISNEVNAKKLFHSWVTTPRLQYKLTHNGKPFADSDDMEKKTNSCATPGQQEYSTSDTGAFHDAMRTAALRSNSVTHLSHKSETGVLSYCTINNYRRFEYATGSIWNPPGLVDKGDISLDPDTLVPKERLNTCHQIIYDKFMAERKKTNLMGNLVCHTYDFSRRFASSKTNILEESDEDIINSLSYKNHNPEVLCHYNGVLLKFKSIETKFCVTTMLEVHYNQASEQNPFMVSGKFYRKSEITGHQRIADYYVGLDDGEEITPKQISKYTLIGSIRMESYHSLKNSPGRAACTAKLGVVGHRKSTAIIIGGSDEIYNIDGDIDCPGNRDDRKHMCTNIYTIPIPSPEMGTRSGSLHQEAWKRIKKDHIMRPDKNQSWEEGPLLDVITGVRTAHFAKFGKKKHQLVLANWDVVEDMTQTQLNKWFKNLPKKSKKKSGTRLPTSALTRGLTPAPPTSQPKKKTIKIKREPRKPKAKRSEIYSESESGHSGSSSESEYSESSDADCSEPEITSGPLEEEKRGMEEENEEKFTLMGLKVGSPLTVEATGEWSWVVAALVILRNDGIEVAAALKEAKRRAAASAFASPRGAMELETPVQPPS